MSWYIWDPRTLHCLHGWDIPGCHGISGTLGPYTAPMGGTSQDVPGILGKLGCQTGCTSIVGITQGIPGDPSHDFHILRQSVAVLDHPEGGREGGRERERE